MTAEVDISPGDFAAAVEHWAWFPSDDAMWGRSVDPYDIREGERRWLAWPTEDGSVRCRVESDDVPGNAGFYVDIGPIGGVESISVDSEVAESDSGEQQLVFAIYLDVTGSGDFFKWDAGDERETFAGFGGDVEGIGLVPSGGTLTIDDGTEMELLPSPEDRIVALDDFKAGQVDGVDESTQAALQISVVASGPGAVEEAVIHDISAETVSIYEPPTESWPMYCHDNYNTGHNAESYGPTGSVDLLWDLATDGAVRASPAVVDRSVFVGSDDGYVYAIDTDTGEQRWAFETGGPVRSSPAVFFDRVIVGSDDHRIYAIDNDTGELVWDYETGGRVRAPPLVEADVWGDDVDNIVAVGSHDGAMYVLDPITGESVHIQSTDGPINHSAMSLVWGYQWELIWGSDDSERHYWRPASPYPSLPLDAPKTAATTWDEENRVMHEVMGFLGRRRGGQFQDDWRFHADDEIHASPALGSHIYVGSWDGTFYAINYGTGEPAWTFDTGDKIDASPAVAGEGVYFSSTDGHLYGLEAESGEVLWSFETGGPIHSSPAVVEGVVFVGSDDGHVYAVTDR